MCVSVGCHASESFIAFPTPFTVWVVAVGPVLCPLRCTGSVGGADRALINHLFLFRDDLAVAVGFRFSLALLPLLALTPINRTGTIISLGRK